MLLTSDIENRYTYIEISRLSEMLIFGPSAYRDRVILIDIMNGQIKSFAKIVTDN